MADNATLDALDVGGRGVQVTGSNLSILNSLALETLVPGIVQGSTTGLQSLATFDPDGSSFGSVVGTSNVNGSTTSAGIAGTDLFYTSTSSTIMSSPGYTLQEGLSLTNTDTSSDQFIIGGDIALTLPSPGVPGVPEPSSLALCGIAGAFGLAVARARRKRVR